jgi:D-alanyl-D-alanine carboxypeptidase/D-alanyl-D-alanine-endopeptidase (penicillin-binding protein 4)
MTGKVISDALLFEPETVPDNWVWVDLGNYYGAGVSALSIHDNLYRLYFKPGKHPGDPAEILHTRPAVPGLVFLNRMRTGKKGSGDNGYIFRAPNCFQAETRGTIPAGVDSFSIKGSLPKPALFTARYLEKQLRLAGLSIRKPAEQTKAAPAYKTFTLFHTTFSPTLSDIIYMLNKRSVNLYAEMLLRALPVAQGEKGSLNAGLKHLRDFLETHHIADNGYQQEDGSGLSRNNHLTPRMMVRLLDHMRLSPNFNYFYNSLAVAGNPKDPGYFRQFGAGTVLADNCRIKSGLIQDVRSFSGYVKDPQGKWILFSFLVNNFEGQYKKVDAVFKEILLQLAR